MRKAGFTVVEMMVATTIITVIMASFGTLYLGITRCIRESYGEAVASVELREMRERTLFKTVREGSSVSWGGLLSASSLSLSPESVGYTANGVAVADGAARTLANESWNKGPVDYTVFAKSHLFTITLTNVVSGVTRTQRVVVPAFGFEQVRNASHIFHD